MSLRATDGSPAPPQPRPLDVSGHGPDRLSGALASDVAALVEARTATFFEALRETLSERGLPDGATLSLSQTDGADGLLSVALTTATLVFDANACPRHVTVTTDPREAILSLLAAEGIGMPDGARLTVTDGEDGLVLTLESAHLSGLVAERGSVIAQTFLLTSTGDGAAIQRIGLSGSLDVASSLPR